MLGPLAAFSSKREEKDRSVVDKTPKLVGGQRFGRRSSTSSTCTSGSQRTDGGRSVTSRAQTVTTSPTLDDEEWDCSIRSSTLQQPPAVKLDCTTQVHADDISYDTASKVSSSWNGGILTVPSWEATVGETFLREIFLLEPATIEMFGFPKGTRHNDPDLSKNVAFMMKAKNLIKAIDMAIGFLGPDLEPLQDTLFDLGKRHYTMGCQPEHWVVVGEALLYSFEQHMMGGFPQELRDSWTLVYNFLSYHMIQGLNAKYEALKKDKSIPRLRLHHPEPANFYETNTSINLDCTVKVPVETITYDQVQAVVTSWDTKIKTIPNWWMVTGEAFLRSILKREPRAASMFGLPDDTRYDDPALSESRMFMTKGQTLIKAIDMAVSFLGPDLSLIEYDLYDIGKRHVALDCRPSQWEAVGFALFDVLEEYMGDTFTSDDKTKQSWAIMYRFWGYSMIQGLLHVKPEWAGL